MGQKRFFSFSDTTCKRITKSLIPKERINSFLWLPRSLQRTPTSQVSGKGARQSQWEGVGGFAWFERTNDSEGNDSTELLLSADYCVRKYSY